MAKTINTTAATSPVDPLLASLDRYKRYANVAGNARDAVITDVLTATSDLVRRICDIDFASAARTEYVSGTDRYRSTFVTLSQRPVTSVTSIGIACGSSGYTAADVDYYRLDPDRGTLHGQFPPGYRNVKVEYVGGYADVPDDVQQAVILIAKAMLDAAGNDSTLQAEKIGDYSYSRFTADGGAQLIPPAARALLAPYMADPF